MLYAKPTVSVLVQDLERYSVLINIPSVRNVLRQSSEELYVSPGNKLLELAAEGLTIREALDAWYVDFRQKHTDESEVLEQNAESILAMAYFHGISIYLSGIFDYHAAQFNGIFTPVIPRQVIQNHVSNILRTTTLALGTTNLSPVLFFFPLRVAGARATCINERGSILNLLQQVLRRFPVADAFIEDLKSLWE